MFLKTALDENLVHEDWPEAKWNISGIFNHRTVLSILVGILTNHDLCHAVGSFNGCPDLIWNGGYANVQIPNIESTKFFRALNEKGIGVFLNFGNLALETRHLSDVESNRLLDSLDEQSGLNGVMVASDLLSDYIGEKKPGLKQICSMDKCIVENPSGDIEWYERMQKRFDRVGVHPNHIFDPDLLDKLDRKKTEILVNDDCMYNCPWRKHHLETISRFNIDPSQEAKNELIHIHRDLCGGKLGIVSENKNPGRIRSCFPKRSELKTIYDMGFRNFAICGRRKSLFGLAWNVAHFLFNQSLAHHFAISIARQVEIKIENQFKELKQKTGDGGK